MTAKATTTDIIQLKRAIDQIRTPPNICGFISEEVDKLIHDRNAWKTACSYIMSVIGEGDSRGRPMDLIRKSDWHRIQILLGVAKHGLGEEDMKGRSDV